MKKALALILTLALLLALPACGLSRRRLHQNRQKSRHPNRLRNQPQNRHLSPRQNQRKTKRE